MSAESDNFYGLLNKIKDEFPAIFGILNQPGVLQVALEMIGAEAAGTPWTQAQIEARMAATPYGQTHNVNQRAWDALSATDPATAATKLTNVNNAIDDLMRQTGVSLSKEGGLASAYVQFINNAVTQNWDPTQIKYQLLAAATKSPGNNISGTGDVGNFAVQAHKAFDDQGVPLSDIAAMQYGLQLSQGAIDMNTVQGAAAAQAMSLFPGLKDAIGRGITVRQYASPYLQIAQQNLGIDPASMSLTDPKWMAALNQVDPKSGQRVSMSLSDWTQKVRSDPTYGYNQTIQGNAEATGLATKLAQKMGAIG